MPFKTFYHNQPKEAIKYIKQAKKFYKIRYDLRKSKPDENGNTFVISPLNLNLYSMSILKKNKLVYLSIDFKGLKSKHITHNSNVNLP